MLNSYLKVLSQEGFLIIIDNSEINTFIQQRCIKLIASKDSKNIENVTKYLYFKLMLFRKVASSSLGMAGIVGGGSECTALSLHPQYHD